MTTRCLTLNHQTRLAVRIVIEDETGTLALSIEFVTGLLALLYQLCQTVSAAGYEVVLLASDFSAALSFTSKIFTIGFNALAFGFGVNL